MILAVGAEKKCWDLAEPFSLRTLERGREPVQSTVFETPFGHVQDGHPRRVSLTESSIRAGQMRCLDILALALRYVGIRCRRGAAHDETNGTDDQRNEEQSSAHPWCNEHRS